MHLYKHVVFLGICVEFPDKQSHLHILFKHKHILTLKSSKNKKEIRKSERRARERRAREREKSEREREKSEYAPIISISTDEIFLKDFLVILKR